MSMINISLFALSFPTSIVVVHFVQDNAWLRMLCYICSMNLHREQHRMRKVITFNLLSVDGSFARPGGELDWFQVDDEFFPFSNDQLDASDMLLFGRVTYTGMESYWTTPEAMRDDPGTTTRM